MWTVLWQPQRGWMFTCKFRADSSRAVETCFEKQGCPSLLLWPRAGLADIKHRYVYGVDILADRTCLPFPLCACRFNKYVCITYFWMHILPWCNHCKRKWKAIIKLCWSETECALKELSRLLCDIFRRKYFGGFRSDSFFTPSYLAIFT